MSVSSIVKGSKARFTADILATVAISAAVQYGVEAVAKKAGMQEHRAAFLADTVCTAVDVVYSARMRPATALISMGISSYSFYRSIKTFREEESKCRS